MTFILSLLNIIIIDLVLSWDNAIIIGMATRNLPAALRKKAIVFGIIAATILRIVFAVFAVYLLWIIGLKLVGALLLLYVVWKFYKELRSKQSEEEQKVKSATSLWQAIWVIVVADLSLSLDNVLAVAWSAHGNTIALWIWLLVSVILMWFASNAIAKNLHRFPRIQRLWLLVILWTAMGMIFEWSHELTDKLLHINIIPRILAVVAIIFAYIHDRYIKPADEEKFYGWLRKNYGWLIASLLLIILALIVDKWAIHTWLFTHPWTFYTVLFIIYVALLELLMLQGWRKRIFKKRK
jgi:YjbE family integral membrane protein